MDVATRCAVGIGIASMLLSTAPPGRAHPAEPAPASEHAEGESSDDAPTKTEPGLADYCKRPRKTLRYPERARSAGVEGTVALLMLNGPDGRWVPKRDPRCKVWHQQSPAERRGRWHPHLCIHARSGPDELASGPIRWAASIQCKPVDQRAIWWRLPFNFSLDD